MSSTRFTLRALAALLPLGAMGVSAALAAAPEPPAAAEADPAARTGVAERLQAIREAVSEVTAEQANLEPGDPNILKAWWGNGGWRNGGWRNGGWGNGGWHNWGNGWPNWHNFWRNW
ncbi:MAG: GrrA/OscA1 family cyclophane-containing rSAM-modified RiPP [Acetobacteraceae bacterium]